MPQSWGAVLHSLLGVAFVWVGGYEQVREADQGAGRRHGLQHPVLRADDADRARQRGRAASSCRAFRRAAAPTCCRSSAASAGRSRCCPTTTGCARRRCSGAGLPSLRPRRHRRRLCLHRHLRHVDHADRQPARSTCRGSPSPTRRPCRGWPRCSAPSLARSASGPTRWASGPPSSPRCSACGRACRISTPTSTASSRASRPTRAARTSKGTSRPYRLALLFITLVPLPLAFTGNPIAVIITFTIVGSLFIPFLAATLLYLNNRVRMVVVRASQPLDDKRAALGDPRAVCRRRCAGGDRRVALRPRGLC